MWNGECSGFVFNQMASYLEKAGQLTAAAEQLPLPEIRIWRNSMPNWPKRPVRLPNKWYFGGSYRRRDA